MADTTISKRVVPVAVKVTVSDGGDVGITCTPNPAPVPASNSLLAFTLVTPGYRFRKSRTIELDVPDTDFPYDSWTMTDTLATLYDLNNNKDAFAYTVYVVDESTGQEYSVDPIIQNGGGGPGTGD